MNTRKIRVAVIFGGRSAEHEVSLQSARNVIQALDSRRYDPVLIGIDRQGRWFHNTDSLSLLNAADPRLIALNAQNQRQIVLSPDGVDGMLVDKASNAPLGKVDVLFPVLHGTYGEDGSIQGLARMADIPCVGADILGSAVGMDKDVMKRLLRDAGIPVSPFFAFESLGDALEGQARVFAALGGDLFVKPANQGSSVGISHVRSGAEYAVAVEHAFLYDTKIIVEQTIKGREIEVAVLGNREPRASVVGEIIPSGDFYSYEAKYVDEHGAALQIPALLDPALAESIRKDAIKAYRALCLKGMSRVDFFLTPDGTALVNEVNTIPGFTNVSMYPKLWEATGLGYSELLDTLIDLSLEEAGRRRVLKVKPD